MNFEFQLLLLYLTDERMEGTMRVIQWKDDAYQNASEVNDCIYTRPTRALTPAGSMQSESRSERERLRK